MHRGFIIFLLLREALALNATSNWSVVTKVLEDCANKSNSLACVQKKFINFANRALELESIEVFRGFKFVRDQDGDKKLKSVAYDSPRDLYDEIWNWVLSFFTTHSVEVNLPRFLDAVSLLEETRKKKGGYGELLLIGGAMKGAMIYMGMSAVAALAGKALLVAKVALTIASTIALKKLFDGGGGKTSYEIIKTPQHSFVQTHSSSQEFGHGHGHGGGYDGHFRKRSIDSDQHQNGGTSSGNSKNLRKELYVHSHKTHSRKYRHAINVSGSNEPPNSRVKSNSKAFARK